MPESLTRCPSLLLACGTTGLLLSIGCADSPTLSDRPSDPPAPTVRTAAPANNLVPPAPSATQVVPSLLPGDPTKWQLIWSEEFSGTDRELDARWSAQNGPNTHILCSRWRENVKMADGVLTITNRKEQRGGQEWTSGSITSKEQFLYGYYECRYRYAAATGTNNSFWLMTTGPAPKVGKRFEIDINEGHYPNEIATNIHNWSDFWEENGKKKHHSASKSFRLGARPDFSTTLENPLTTRKLRLVGRSDKVIHLREFRAFAPGKTYPNATAPERSAGPQNLIRMPGTTITASGSISGKTGSALTAEAAKAADGQLASEWISSRTGDKWIEFTFAKPQTIGHLQFLSGYEAPSGLSGILEHFAVQYDQDGTWTDLATASPGNGSVDLAKDYHLYGLEWTPTELVFYHDGKELRRVKNEFCHSPSPVWLSLAIIAWAGPITPAIDGTSMVVEFVRIYQRPTAP